MTYLSRLWATPLSPVEDQFFDRHFKTRPILNSQIKTSSVTIRTEIKNNVEQCLARLPSVAPKLRQHVFDLIAQSTILYHQKSVYSPDLDIIAKSTGYNVGSIFFSSIQRWFQPMITVGIDVAATYVNSGLSLFPRLVIADFCTELPKIVALGTTAPAQNYYALILAFALEAELEILQQLPSFWQNFATQAVGLTTVPFATSIYWLQQLLTTEPTARDEQNFHWTEKAVSILFTCLSSGLLHWHNRIAHEKVRRLAKQVQTKLIIYNALFKILTRYCRRELPKSPINQCITSLPLASLRTMLLLLSDAHNPLREELATILMAKNSEFSDEKQQLLLVSTEEKYEDVTRLAELERLIRNEPIAWQEKNLHELRLYHAEKSPVQWTAPLQHATDLPDEVPTLPPLNEKLKKSSKTRHRTRLAAAAAAAPQVVQSSPQERIAVVAPASTLPSSPASPPPPSVVRPLPTLLPQLSSVSLAPTASPIPPVDAQKFWSQHKLSVSIAANVGVAEIASEILSAVGSSGSSSPSAPTPTTPPASLAASPTQTPPPSRTSPPNATPLSPEAQPFHMAEAVPATILEQLQALARKYRTLELRNSFLLRYTQLQISNIELCCTSLAILNSTKNLTEALAQIYREQQRHLSELMPTLSIIPSATLHHEAALPFLIKHQKEQNRLVESLLSELKQQYVTAANRNLGQKIKYSLLDELLYFFANFFASPLTPKYGISIADYCLIEATLHNVAINLIATDPRLEICQVGTRVFLSQLADDIDLTVTPRGTAFSSATPRPAIDVNATGHVVTHALHANRWHYHSHKQSTEYLTYSYLHNEPGLLGIDVAIYPNNSFEDFFEQMQGRLMNYASVSHNLLTGRLFINPYGIEGISKLQLEFLEDAPTLPPLLYPAQTMAFKCDLKIKAATAITQQKNVPAGSARQTLQAGAKLQAFTTAHFNNVISQIQFGVNLLNHTKAYYHILPRWSFTEIALHQLVTQRLAPRAIQLGIYMAGQNRATWGAALDQTFGSMTAGHLKGYVLLLLTCFNYQIQLMSQQSAHFRATEPRDLTTSPIAIFWKNLFAQQFFIDPHTQHMGAILGRIYDALCIYRRIPQQWDFSHLDAYNPKDTEAQISLACYRYLNLLLAPPT